jgi:yeast amino acid transporter
LQGHSVDELPFKAVFGVTGSYICAVMNLMCLIAQFYVALYPVGGPNLNAETFFSAYLAGPFLIFLYAAWKIWAFIKIPEHRPLYVKIKDIDIYSGMRQGQLDMISGADVSEEQRRQSIAELRQDNEKGGVMGWAKAAVRTVL